LLRAEKITYDADTSDYTAQGPITYQDRGLLLSADAASGNADRDQCTLEGVRYQLLGSRGNGVASVAITTDVDHARLTGATFSTCDVANQQWAFAAREIELDRAEGIGRARDVTFRVRNVPVFWLPYARFPLDDRRVSGFLFPNVGFSDQRGFDLTLPYYFNIAPNYDATLAPRLMTERGLMLGGEFRYLADASSGTFNFEFLPDDRRADDEEREYGENLPGSRWWYQWRNTTSFNEAWGANVDLFDLITGDARDRVAALLDADPGALDRPITAYGGDPGETNVKPLAWALERGRPEIVDLLRARGA
jgi:LPS-assembly protein